MHVCMHVWRDVWKDVYSALDEGIDLLGASKAFGSNPNSKEADQATLGPGDANKLQQVGHFRV